MMQTTLTAKRTEKGKALSAMIGNGVAQGHADTQVYIPDWVGVKELDREIVVEDCADVEQAVKAISKYRKQNVLLLLRYTDGSRVITVCDMRTERILASWLDDLPIAIKSEVYFYCLECGKEFVANGHGQLCEQCAGVGV